MTKNAVACQRGDATADQLDQEIAKAENERVESILIVCLPYHQVAAMTGRLTKLGPGHR